MMRFERPQRNREPLAYPVPERSKWLALLAVLTSLIAIGLFGCSTERVKSDARIERFKFEPGYMRK